MRTIVVLVMVLLVLPGCAGSPPENPEWWDAQGNQQPTASQSLGTAGGQAGTVILAAAGLVALGLGYLWLQSRDDDEHDQHFYDYGY